jgi:hypothetical protein
MKPNNLTSILCNTVVTTESVMDFKNNGYKYLCKNNTTEVPGALPPLLPNHACWCIVLLILAVWVPWLCSVVFAVWVLWPLQCGFCGP